MIGRFSRKCRCTGGIENRCSRAPARLASCTRSRVAWLGAADASSGNRLTAVCAASSSVSGASAAAASSSSSSAAAPAAPERRCSATLVPSAQRVLRFTPPSVAVGIVPGSSTRTISTSMSQCTADA